MIFYKVILYGVNFVLPHSMSAKNEIKFLVFTAASPKGLRLLACVFGRFLLHRLRVQAPQWEHTADDQSTGPRSASVGPAP